MIKKHEVVLLETILLELRQLRKILEKDEKIMSKINDSVAALTATVTAVESKDEAILSYVKGVPALITAAVEAANGDTNVAVDNINALAASLATSPDAILAAINANTPAVPPAPDAPPATA